MQATVILAPGACEGGLGAAVAPAISRREFRELCEFREFHEFREFQILILEQPRRTSGPLSWEANFQKLDFADPSHTCAFLGSSAIARFSGQGKNCSFGFKNGENTEKVTFEIFREKAKTYIPSDFKNTKDVLPVL